MTLLSGQTIQTYAQWLDAVGQLNRLRPEAMEELELDVAAAMLFVRPALTSDQSDAVYYGKLVPELRSVLNFDADGNPRVQIKGTWVPFSVTRDWTAFGLLISTVGMVVGTHESEQDGEQVVWHSCHSFLSGTRSEGYADLRVIVAQTAARLLQVLPRC